MRIMRRAFISIILAVASYSVAQSQELSNDIREVTAKSKWSVSEFRNGESIIGFHAVPWTFEPDGTVYAGDLWSGNWAKHSDDTVRVAIQDNAGNIDRFQVQFIRGRYFIGWKDGQIFRWGRRQVRATLVP
jgi:hypothetical protein